MRTTKPNDTENSLCFQIFGFDIMLDSDLKPWLIEVNHSPSFLADSALDLAIKKNLLRDTIHMLNLTNKRKKAYVTADNPQQRLVEGHVKMTNKEK